MLCPEIDELEQLSENELETPRASKLWDHIEVCSECNLRVQEVTDNLRAATWVRDVVSNSTRGGIPSRVGSYRILSEIGRGGMGLVYEAEDPALDRRIALKLLGTSHALVTEDRLARFRKEAQLLASLNHPNLATVFSLEEAEGYHFLTMELVSGENLAERIKGRPLGVETSLATVRQIGKALEAAHRRGIIHRDLKPHNVMAPENGPVKVLDFGIAEVFGRGPSPDHLSNEVVGTPGFMSPEQIDGRGVDHRADIWALGCILFECLTGKRPFDGETPSLRIEATRNGEVDWNLLPAALPEPVGTLLRRCLEKNPEKRPRDVTEIVTVLESELARPVFLDDFESGRIRGAGNLPRRISSFVGRVREMEDLREKLTQSRLVSLIGPGGCGKSRLSVEAATSMAADFPDGIWLVELAPVMDPESVPRRLAEALNIQEEKGCAVMDTVIARLADWEALIILDNCDHLVTACAEMTQCILEASPDIRILVTSREALCLSGETILATPPLGIPKEDDPLESVRETDAVRLFTTRVGAVVPDFVVDSENLESVRQICRRLDGVPLALELAAARARLFSPAEIARHLDDRFRLLSGGNRASLPRHQTLSASIDWSYSLLDAPEKKVLQRLAVFSGGWSLEASEAVCGGDGVSPWEVFDCFSRLMNKSLIERDQEVGEGNASRYKILESIRHYALDKLAETGEGEAIRRRHRNHFLSLAEEGEPHLTGPEQKQWTSQLTQDHDNFRAAIELSVSLGEIEAGMRLAGSLGRAWGLAGKWTEGRSIYKQLLDAKLPSNNARARIKCLNWAGNLAQYQGEYVVAQDLLTQSLDLCQTVGERWYEASAHNNLGAIARFTGDFVLAEKHHLQALAIREELGDSWAIALSLHHLGTLAAGQGEGDRALPYLERGLGLARLVEDPNLLAALHVSLGITQQGRRNSDKACTTFAESLRLFQGCGDSWGVALAHHHLATVKLELGDLNEARTHVRESLDIRKKLNDRQAVSQSLILIAELVMCSEDAERAAQFLGASEAIREAGHIGLTPLEEKSLNRVETQVGRRLEPDRLTALRREGESWPLEDAVLRARTALTQLDVRKVGE